jgi:translation initiation factor IF-3
MAPGKPGVQLRQEGCRITTTPTTTGEPRINDRIRAREVRLVDPEGQQLGIKALPEALTIARQLDLDLVEVAPLANPPVCRIMDYGKFKFDAAQRAKESRRKTTSVGIKEMKYRPKIGPGDFDTKTKKVLKFLDEGHKVKVTIMFRGREVYHPELGKRILDKVAEHVDGTARVETEARLDGRNMVMVLAPDKRAKQSAAAKAGTEHGHVEGDGHLGTGPVVGAAAPPQSEAIAPVDGQGVGVDVGDDVAGDEPSTGGDLKHSDDEVTAGVAGDDPDPVADADNEGDD